MDWRQRKVAIRRRVQAGMWAMTLNFLLTLTWEAAPLQRREDLCLTPVAPARVRFEFSLNTYNNMV